MTAPDITTFYAMLADATRRRILALLTEAGELCVCELVQALALAQPRVSSHLAALRKAGLVNARREGLWVHYSPHPGLPGWQREALAALHAGMKGDASFMADLARLRASCAKAPEGTEEGA